MRDPFHYIPPSPTTAPKYAAIRDATNAADEAIAGALFDFDVSKADKAACFDTICAAAKSLHDVIEATCPPSADTTTAIRSVRLARMRANESVTSVIELDWRSLLTDARMWACAAVALADEPAAGGGA